MHYTPDLSFCQLYLSFWFYQMTRFFLSCEAKMGFGYEIPKQV